MTSASMLPTEKAFYRLMSELASDGLFTGPERDGMWERIVEAFEAAMAEARANKNGGASAPPHQTSNDVDDRLKHPVQP